MNYWYDEEVPAGFQAADIEQAQLEAEAAAISAARRSGRCAHQGVVGHRGDPSVPAGMMRCTDGCGRIFRHDEEWMEAIEDAIH